MYSKIALQASCKHLRVSEERPLARFCHTLAPVDNSLVLIGGGQKHCGKPSADVYVFDLGVIVRLHYDLIFIVQKDSSGDNYWVNILQFTVTVAMYSKIVYMCLAAKKRMAQSVTRRISLQ